MVGTVTALPFRCPICDRLVKKVDAVVDPYLDVDICRECASGARLLRVLDGKEEMKE